MESFVKIETRYVHYKEKLNRLVGEVEERKINGKKTQKKKIKRIERVRFRDINDLLICVEHSEV